MSSGTNDSAACGLLVETRGGVTRIRFAGEEVPVDAMTALRAEADLVATEPGGRLLVDLTGVSMVNSSMLGLLTDIHKTFGNKDARLHVAAPDPLVMEMFEVTFLHRVLHLFRDADEAIARFE